MFPNLFKMIPMESFTIYKWVHTLNNCNYSSALLWDKPEELKAYLILCKNGLSIYKGKCTITFYNDKNEVINIVPISWDRVIDRDFIMLYSYLKENRFRWLNIPEVIFLNDSSKSNLYGLGQIVPSTNGELVTPIIPISLYGTYVTPIEKLSDDDYNVDIDIEYDLLQYPTLRYRVCDFTMDVDFKDWVSLYSIDLEFDLYPKEIEADILDKYCVQRLTLLLPELTDEQASFLNDKLEGVNLANFSSSYPLEYKVVKVGSVWQLMYYLYNKPAHIERRLRYEN